MSHSHPKSNHRASAVNLSRQFLSDCVSICSISQSKFGDSFAVERVNRRKTSTQFLSGIHPWLQPHLNSYFATLNASFVIVIIPLFSSYTKIKNCSISVSDQSVFSSCTYRILFLAFNKYQTYLILSSKRIHSSSATENRSNTI